jgi:antitoxin PrlF
LSRGYYGVILTVTGKKGAAMRITSKGQVTIPQAIRERAGLTPGTDVEFALEKGIVRLVKSKGRRGSLTRGEKIVEQLRGHGDFKMSADEIIALMRGPPADDL